MKFHWACSPAWQQVMVGLERENARFFVINEEKIYIFDQFFVIVVENNWAVKEEIRPTEPDRNFSGPGT